MKKLFVFAAALLALASCSKNEEPQAIVETREISFAPAATETRATDVKEYTIADLQNDGFAVWGYQQGTGATDWTSIFNGTAVKYVDATNATSQFGEGAENPVSKVWQPEGSDVKYWAPSSSYWFSAIYPGSGVTYKYSTTGNSHTQAIEGFSLNGALTEDIVVARPAKAILAANAHSRAAVGLTFDHMLSRVHFSFENIFADDNVIVKITNVVLNEVIATGDATITSTGAATWTDKATAKGTINFLDTATEVLEEENSNEVGLAQNEKGTTEYRLFMPEASAVSYKLSFDLEVISDNVTVLTKSYKDNDIIVLNSTQFTNGQSYLFNAKIDGDLLKNEIFPIQFDVEVTKWADDTTVDDDIMK